MKKLVRKIIKEPGYSDRTVWALFLADCSDCLDTGVVIRDGRKGLPCRCLEEEENRRPPDNSIEIKKLIRNIVRARKDILSEKQEYSNTDNGSVSVPAKGDYLRQKKIVWLVIVGPSAILSLAFLLL